MIFMQKLPVKMAEKLNENKLEFIYLHGILNNCTQVLFKS